MKIGILTFHCAINYGAIMQTYGLQEYLKNLGHEVYVLDYRPGYLLTPYKIFKWKWSSHLSLRDNVKYLLRDILLWPVRAKRKSVFRKFLKKNISLWSFNPNRRDNDFEAFVLGSDQIWNPAITNGLDDIYFGKFPASEGKKIIPYAASVGSIQNVSHCAEELFSKLQSCTSVGVRESSLLDLLRGCGKEVSVTLDPVLLVGKEAFRKLFVERKIARPYLLCFQLCYDDGVFKVAKQIAEEKNLELIQIVSSSESIKNKDLLVSESPESFLALLSGASYVVTSSFHGTAFSILFEKDFNIVSINSALSERMSNILSLLDLKNRFVDDVRTIDSSPIVYQQVNERLEDLRLISDKFLKDALS